MSIRYDTDNRIPQSAEKFDQNNNFSIHSRHGLDYIEIAVVTIIHKDQEQRTNIILLLLNIIGFFFAV